MEDREIIERFLRRDESAITEAKNKYHRYLSYIASNVLSSAQDVEECENDVYFSAWTHIPPDEPQSLKLYLAKLMRCRAVDVYRAESAAKRGGTQKDLSLEELLEAMPEQADPSTGNTVEEAIEEADYVLSLLNGFALTLPVFIDVEMITYDTARLDEANLTPAQLTEICKAFCSVIEAGGYQAGIYANKYYLQNELFTEELEQKYAIWLANYTAQTSYTGEYQIWQYSENGIVNGINHAVDMNVSYSRRVSYAADSLTIHEGQSISPVLSGDSILSYRSSDPLTASVDRNGVIKALQPGIVTVTAVSSNGTSDAIEIRITEDPSFRINYADMIYSYSANPLPGDSNFDGQINASDAAQMLIHSAQSGSGSSEAQIDDLQQISFDYNNDGIVDASDASCVLIYSAALGAGC